MESLSPLDDVRSWGDDQWDDFLQLVRSLSGEEAEGDKNSPAAADRDPAFFRFARALAAVGGYGIPEWVLHPARRRDRTAARSAASIWVGREHFTAAREKLRKWLEDEPWTLRRALVLTDILEEGPFRISEIATLVADCVTADEPHLVVRPATQLAAGIASGG